MVSYCIVFATSDTSILTWFLFSIWYFKFRILAPFPFSILFGNLNFSSNGYYAVLASKGGTVASESPISSLPKLNDNVSTEQLDMKLEKLKIFAHQPVILPDHLQVPEALKTGLTFGSLEAPMEQSMNSSNDKPTPVVDQTSREASMR